jgi:hypothetical protein
MAAVSSSKIWSSFSPTWIAKVGSSQKLRLYIRMLDASWHTVDIFKTDSTVLQLKATLQAALGIPLKHLRLCLASKVLDDDFTLAEAKVNNEANIQVLLRLRGGADGEVPQPGDQVDEFGADPRMEWPARLQERYNYELTFLHLQGLRLDVPLIAHTRAVPPPPVDTPTWIGSDVDALSESLNSVQETIAHPLKLMTIRAVMITSKSTSTWTAKSLRSR